MDRRAATCLRLQLSGVPRWITEHGSEPLLGPDALLAARVAVLGPLDSDDEVGLHWPDHADPGKNNLNVRLSRLRARLGHDVFSKTRDAIGLLPEVDVDVLGPPSAWPQGDDPREVQFLHGVEAPRTLAGWLAAQRERWAGALLAAQHLRRVAELEAAETAAETLDLARRAIDAAPWLAEAWLARARLLYLAGEVEEARRALERTLASRPLHAETRARALDLRRALDLSLSAAPRRAPLPVALIRPPVLIGRDATWAAMNQAWAQRRAFVLIGEAGLGKSRLLEEFRRDKGCGLLVAADFRDERAPYATLGAVLARVLQQRGQAPGDAPAPLAGILGQLGDERPDAPVDEVAVRQAACVVLAAAADDLGAIMIDRLDRADPASIDVLRTLADGALRDRLRFAFASRPPVPGRRRDTLEAWFASPQGALPLPLTPWRPEQVGELLHSLELTKAAAQITPTELHARTGGMPQLVLFTLQRLASRDQPDPPAAPSSLPTGDERTELMARLRSVPAAARPLLELAAVVEADAPLLARALGCSEADVAAMAAELALHGVMLEGRFLHDLMREAALESLPPAALQRWSAVAAAMLAPDPRVPRTRIAAHWEAAERWPEAAATYLSAALQAEDLGRPDVARELLHQSAACAVLAHDPAGEFAALLEALPIERQLIGHEAACRMLDRLRALCATPRQSAQVALAAALLEVSRYQRGAAALSASTLAKQAAEGVADNALRARAMSLHAAALAQAGRHADAVAEGHRARRLALLAMPPRQSREIGSDLCYVFYEASRFDAGIALAGELLTDYEAARDLAGAGAMQGNLAMLHLLSGDPSSAIVHGRHALARHRDLDGKALGDMAVMHRAGLALALGHHGHFSEALGLLSEDGHAIETAPLLPAVRAKAQLVRARLLLWLGDDAGAEAALDDDVQAWPMAMQAQRCWVQACAARLRGDDAASPLRQIAALVAGAGETALVHLPWFEWSYQGEAGRVDVRLREVHRCYVESGMAGAARSVLLRRIDRLGELALASDRQEAAALAGTVREHLHEGLHATTYLPEAWLVIARALRRVGDEAAASSCLKQARAWVEQAAQLHVPADRLDAFLTRNPVHRELGMSIADARLRPAPAPADGTRGAARQ